MDNIEFGILIGAAYLIWAILQERISAERDRVNKEIEALRFELKRKGGAQ